MSPLRFLFASRPTLGATTVLLGLSLFTMSACGGSSSSVSAAPGYTLTAAALSPASVAAIRVPAAQPECSSSRGATTRSIG